MALNKTWEVRADVSLGTPVDSITVYDPAQKGYKLSVEDGHQLGLLKVDSKTGQVSVATTSLAQQVGLLHPLLLTMYKSHVFSIASHFSNGNPVENI